MLILTIGIIVAAARLHSSDAKEEVISFVAIILATVVLLGLGISHTTIEYVPVPTSDVQCEPCESNSEVISALGSCIESYSAQTDSIENFANCIVDMQRPDDLFNCVEWFADDLSAQYK